MVKIQENIRTAKETALFAEVLDVEQAAWQSKFYLREPNKITATAFLQAFFEMHQKGKNTLSSWSACLAAILQEDVTSQSLNERLDERAVDLAKTVLINALDTKTSKKHLEDKLANHSDSVEFFNRILIRDSTTQQLSGHLATDFPGSHSHGKPTAIARIQALFSFTEAKWINFEVSAYTDNDQKAASSIIDDLQDKDLILQDLGYFTLSWLEQVIEKQYIVSYYKSGVHLYNEAGEQLDLVSLLKQSKVTDMPVWVGAQKRVPMRLVAKKLPEAKAKRKIREAQKNRHSKSNHSAEYYNLLRYEIYLTNVPPHVLNAKNIAKIYGLRWYIETLFKSWKSYAKFKCLFEKNKMKLHRTLFTIYAVLAEFVFLQNHILNYFKKKIKFGDRVYISCHKYMATVNDIFDSLIKVKTFDELLLYAEVIRRKAVYTKRTKRKNTIEKYLYVNELCIVKNLT